MFHGQVAHLGPQSRRRCIHCIVAQAKLSLPGLRAPERPLFTHTHTLNSGLNLGDATGTQGIGV